MEFDCEAKAGYKHHLSTAYLTHLKQEVIDMCKKKDYIRLICSLLLKEKSQKKNIGHNAVDRKSSMN